MSIAAPALSAGSDPSLASAGSRAAGRILSRIAGQELETVMNGPHLSVLPRDGGPVSAWMLEPAAPLPLLQPVAPSKSFPGFPGSWRLAASNGSRPPLPSP